VSYIGSSIADRLAGRRKCSAVAALQKGQRELPDLFGVRIEPKERLIGRTNRHRSPCLDVQNVIALQFSIESDSHEFWRQPFRLCAVRWRYAVHNKRRQQMVLIDKQRIQQTSMPSKHREDRSGGR
jgi:hypothetical protein